MAPFASSIIPLLALLLGSTTAFVTPTGRGASWSLPAVLQSSTSTAVARQAIRRPSRCLSMMAAAGGSEVEVVQEKAARLRETAAVFRAQAAELEDKRTQERQASADRSFNSLDSNKDGTVDVVELKAGLEGPLRRSFVKQLTARMGDKPDYEEVSRVGQGYFYLMTTNMYRGRIASFIDGTNNIASILDTAVYVPRSYSYYRV